MTYAAGDLIEHKEMPGFSMTVHEVQPCEDGDHQQVRIVDPEGSEDWLCTHDVQPART
jgi:hypothetical protein